MPATASKCGHNAADPLCMCLHCREASLERKIGTRAQHTCPDCSSRPTATYVPCDGCGEYCYAWANPCMDCVRARPA